MPPWKPWRNFNDLVLAAFWAAVHAQSGLATDRLNGRHEFHFDIAARTNRRVLLIRHDTTPPFIGPTNGGAGRFL